MPHGQDESRDRAELIIVGWQTCLPGIKAALVITFSLGKQEMEHSPCTGKNLTMTNKNKTDELEGII